VSTHYRSLHHIVSLFPFKEREREREREREQVPKRIPVLREAFDRS